MFATRATWQRIAGFPIRERRIVRAGQASQIGGMSFVPFNVEHSLRAPAVGYRITAGTSEIFYCPDLVSIHLRHAALGGIAAYIGDGATISRPLVRKRGNRLIGHAPLADQFAWCKRSGVPRAIITHCGTQIVTAEPDDLARQIAALSRAYHLRVDVAEDGMELVVRRRPGSAPAVRLPA